MRVAKSAPEYFAKVLRNAMAGIGTKDDHVIRVMVSRSEVRRGRFYVSLYGMTLAHRFF